MIDQTTLGHRLIKQQFGVVPKTTWQIDVGVFQPAIYLCTLFVHVLAAFWPQCLPKLASDRSVWLQWSVFRSHGLPGAPLVSSLTTFRCICLVCFCMQDRNYRESLNPNTLEFIWRSSKNYGARAQVRASLGEAVCLGAEGLGVRVRFAGVNGAALLRLWPTWRLLLRHFLQPRAGAGMAAHSISVSPCPHFEPTIAGRPQLVRLQRTVGCGHLR